MWLIMLFVQICSTMSVKRCGYSQNADQLHQHSLDGSFAAQEGGFDGSGHVQYACVID